MGRWREAPEGVLLKTILPVYGEVAAKPPEGQLLR